MFFEILKFIGTLIEVVLLFNLIIVVHELGHFFACRWRGLKVEKFAIWFGKPLWSKKILGIEYCLGSIPAGGYVSIPQLDSVNILEGLKNDNSKNLSQAKPLDKLIVALAGPVASLGLAFFFACIVWIVGRPVNEAETTNIIGYVLDGGPAAKADLRAGDKILAVNGHPVKRINGMGSMRDSVAWSVAVTSSPLIPIRFERDGIQHVVDVEPFVNNQRKWGRKILHQIQILPAVTPIVARVIPESPAAQAGICRGDRIMALNGNSLLSQSALAETLNTTKGNSIILTIRRGNENFPVIVKPRIPDHQKKARIGIEWDPKGIVTIEHPTPLSQIELSFLTIWETISALIDRHSEIGVQQLSGPVGIMRIYYMLFQNPMGWQLALWFSVVLNVNLAVMNILPFPVLDGGHIMIAIIEWICKHPIHHSTIEILQRIFAFLLIGAMLYISFFDLSDLFSPHQSSGVTLHRSEMMTFSTH